MAELGPDADALHRDIGALAASLGYDELVAVGEHAGALVAGATAAGPGTNARAADKADVAGSLELGAGDVVLVKASRVLALEDVTAQLIDRDEEGTAR